MRVQQPSCKLAYCGDCGGDYFATLELEVGPLQHPSLHCPPNIDADVNKTVFMSTHTTLISLALLMLIDHIIYVFGYSLQISETLNVKPA